MRIFFICKCVTLVCKCKSSLANLLRPMLKLFCYFVYNVINNVQFFFMREMNKKTYENKKSLKKKKYIYIYHYHYHTYHYYRDDLIT